MMHELFHVDYHHLQNTQLRTHIADRQFLVAGDPYNRTAYGPFWTKAFARWSAGDVGEYTSTNGTRNPYSFCGQDINISNSR